MLSISLFVCSVGWRRGVAGRPYQQSYSTSSPVSSGMGDHDRVGIPAVISQLDSALYPSAVAKLSTSFAGGKGGTFTSVGWQVTPCDPIWHVSSRSSVAT